MFFPQPAAWLVLASSCGAVMAQQVPPVQAPAAPPPYRSSLEGYQPFADEKVAPWRASNDTVGEIGGWKAYAREASRPAADAAPAAPASAPAPAPAAGDVHRH